MQVCLAPDHLPYPNPVPRDPFPSALPQDLLTIPVAVQTDPPCSLSPGNTEFGLSHLPLLPLFSAWTSLPCDTRTPSSAGLDASLVSLPSEFLPYDTRANRLFSCLFSVLQ